METIRILAVALGCLLAICDSALAGGGNTTDSGSDPETIARHIYLGQLYPSGNIYLVPFPFASDSQSDDDYQRTFPWPKSVSWHAISYASPITHRAMVGHLSRVLQDNPAGPPYIPALEAMDDEHESCDGNPKKPKKNPRYMYLGERQLGVDFFDQVLDNCNSASGTAIYKDDKPGIFSYSVMAFDNQAPLSDIKLHYHKKRPLTPEEAAEVEKDKKDFARNESDCETNPSYLDSATLLMTARVTGTDLTLRLSKYETPGCGGHLADYYILDFLKDGKLIKKYELEHYIGLI